jgi:uncharacterized phiE125 gp8 family phage protein
MGMIRTQVVTTATDDAITLEEIKDHLRVERGETNEDEYLERLRDVATEHVQDLTGLKLLTSVWNSYYDNWPPHDHIDLPYAPLQTVTSTGVTYTPSTGGSLKFSSTGWAKDTVSMPPRVVLKYNDDWPSEQLDMNNPVCVRATYGYTTSSKIPASIKHAMLLMIGNWFEHRESVVMGASPAEIPRYITNMLDRYKVRYLR